MRFWTAHTQYAWSFAIGSALVAFASHAAGAEERTPAQWLQAMDAAFSNLDYDGVFIYYTVNRMQQVAVAHGSQQITGRGRREVTLGFGVGYRTAARLATFRVIHKVVDGVERNRIVHLNGPRREIIRIGEKVHCMLQPGDELQDLEGSIPARTYARIFARRFENMSENYRVEFGGVDRVVSRPAVRLAVLPHNNDRLGYQLWLDRATGLLLRSELHDFEGSSLEIFQFASLKLGDQVSAADLEPSKGDLAMRRLTKPPTPESHATPPSHQPWRVRWIPSGFHLISTDFRQPTSERKGISTLVYSDGLAAFSVFIEAMPEAGAGSVISRSGATVVLTHLASGGNGDHLVTVVGEVPIGTARRIASGVTQQL